MSGLLDNQSPADPPSVYSSGGQNTYANCFTVDGFVTPSAVRYYATQAGANGRPSLVVLYRMSDSTVVRTWSSIPNPSGAGWTDYTPGDMPELAPGIEYRLAWRNVSGTQMPMWTVEPTNAPPAPFAWAGDASLMNVGTSLPATAWTGCVGLGFVAGASTPNPAPPTNGSSNPAPTLAGDLNWWLNIATTNPDSAPKWLYDWWSVDRAVLTAAREAIDAWNTRAGVLFGTSGLLLGGLLAARLDQLLATMDAVDAAIAELGTPAQVSDVAAVGELVANVPALVNDPRRFADVVPIPGDGWTLVDTLTGTGATTWAQPADRYVWRATAWSDSRGHRTINGITYLVHRGWWAPLNVDMVGLHHTIAGVAHELYEPGCRLPGLLLGVDPDIEWTLEAYDYTGS